MKGESNKICCSCTCIWFGVVTLLQWARMSDNLESVEDTKKGSQAEVTDDSCTAQFIEIVPLERPSDDYHRPGFIPPVFEVKPEDLDDVKQEATDESYVSGDSHYYVKEEPDDEYENDPACFTIKVSFLALIAVVQLSQLQFVCTADWSLVLCCCLLSTKMASGLSDIFVP